MQKINLSSAPRLLDNLDALHEDLNAALNRTWLMLSGVVLSSLCLALYVVAFAK